jgi:hypothetical protein
MGETALPDADALRRFLVRKFLTATIRQSSVLVAQDAEAAADTAMAVVGPVLERLHRCCCDHEAWYDSRCPCCNRKAAAIKNGSGEEPATGASG